MSKMTYLWISGVIFQALSIQKLVFGHGSSPDPAGGAYDAPSDSLVGWEGGHSLPHILPPRRLRRLDRAFGASAFRPPTQIPGYAYGLPHFSGLQLAATLSENLAPPLS